MVRARNVFMAALRLRNLSTIEFARSFGLSSPNIRQKLNYRETIRASEFFYLLGLLNIDCCFNFRDDYLPAEPVPDGNEEPSETVEDQEVVVKKHEPIYIATKDIRVKDLFKRIIAEKGVSSYEVSRRLGLNEQSMAQKILQRETIQANEFFDVLSILGVNCVFYDGETRMQFWDDLDGREQAAGMSDNRWYRTNKATLVASSFMADGKNKYGPDDKAVDLYIDGEGYYFMVEYAKGEKARIRAIPVHVAEALLEKYGTKNDPE